MMMRIMDIEQSTGFDDYKLSVSTMCNVLVLCTICSACICKLFKLQVRMIHIVQFAHHISCGLCSC